MANLVAIREPSPRQIMTSLPPFHFRIVAFVLTAFSSPLCAADSGKPNILVIVADDLGYGELGVQGFTKEIPTPHIDSIAQNRRALHQRLRVRTVLQPDARGAADGALSAAVRA